MTLPDDVVPMTRPQREVAGEPVPVMEVTQIPPSIRVCLIGIFMILMIGAIYFAKDILLPIALAFMLTLTLSPVVRYLAKYHVPEALSALVIVLAVVGGSAASIYYLSGPVSGWIDGAPQTGRQIRDWLATRRLLRSALDEFEQGGAGDPPST